MKRPKVYVWLLLLTFLTALFGVLFGVLFDGRASESDVASSAGSEVVTAVEPDSRRAPPLVNYESPRPLKVMDSALVAEGHEVEEPGRVSLYDPIAGSRLLSGSWVFEALDTEASVASIEVVLDSIADGVVALPPGSWRARSADARWTVDPREFELAPGAERVLLASRAGTYQVFVMDARGVGIPAAVVLATSAQSNLWSAVPPTWELALGVTAEVQLADDSGYARVEISSPGAVVLSAVVSNVGAVSWTVLPQPGALYRITLPTLSGATPWRVVDAVTDEPVRGAVFNDAHGILSTPSNDEGLLLLWSGESTQRHWILSAPDYVPLRVSPDSLGDEESFLRLHSQAALHWQLADQAADARGGASAQSVIVSLSPLESANNERLYVRQWEQRGLESGSFVVPRGTVVTMTTTSGRASASLDVPIDHADQYVDLEMGREQDGLTVVAPEGAGDEPIKVHYTDGSSLTVPFVDALAVVPRSSHARRILAPCRGGVLRLHRVDGTTPPPDEGRLDLRLPAATPQRIDLVDEQGQAPSGIALFLDMSRSVADEARSSHPGWHAAYFAPTPEGMSPVTGSLTWELPAGEYSYEVLRLGSQVKLAEGRLVVTGSAGEHRIVVHSARWVTVRATWPDGKAVTRFDVRYEVPWAQKPGSPWALRVGRGAHGHYAGWLPAAPLTLHVTAEGAQDQQLVLDTVVADLAVVLAPLATPLFVDLIDVDETVQGAVMSVFSRNGEFIESVYLTRAANRRFQIPDASIIRNRLVQISFELNEERFESRLLDAATLGAGGIVLQRIGN